MSIADEQRVSASGATTAQSASQPDAYSPQVIRKLNALTSDFYAREAASFSATRQAPWHGWEKAWGLITAPNAAQGPFPSHAAVRDSLSSRAAHCLPTFHENDFLLGWQHAEGVYRFCHHTPEDEIDALLAAIREPSAPSTSGCASAAPPSFREIARFSADGKLGNLILQRL